MQISAEHVVVVVVVGVRRVVVVVVGLRVVVVVVVVVVVGLSLVVVVVDLVEVVVVVVVVVAGFSPDCSGVVLAVVVAAPLDCEAGGIGSTAPSSDGSRSGASSVSVPRANSVQTIAPTTAPTASLPCPGCRVDPMLVSFGCVQPTTGS
ncbi:hypothetical protein [Actinophytocola oryzae]|uniref:hypothetical protein n=1 Tax=Actinophytocola oryzae TaxID=502181 RepID=UPI001062B587|nr:hypothetical protein [Actinophytocola oryzae]